MLRLGPFELEKPLAKGGSGVVWRAAHTDQRVPVAVKLVDTRTDRARAAFRDEVQAMAGLHHPGVVLVFDHGEVGEDHAVDDVPAGASYVAMELASEGSLKSRLGVMAWGELRSTLLALLDALAHAHARGVVHGDLKPGNILVSGPSDVRPGLKIADFGLARAIDRTDELETVAGTPLYMTPEQLRREWRDFGPWTDLYALGMVAWALAAGQPPLHGHTLPNIVLGHVTGQLPAFTPRTKVPQGFAAWLLRMVQVAPRARFRRAADAAWALAALPDPARGDTPMPVGRVTITNPTMTLDDTLLMLASGETPSGSYDRVATPPVGPSPPAGDQVPAAACVPPLPPGWARARPPEPPLQLLGVGLALYGLRTVPMVDRVQERDRIWHALTGTHRTGAAHAVCLRGGAGNGKTRLAEWIAQRAHEVGGAHLIKAVHSPDPTPVDGIGPALARWFQCTGLDRAQVVERLTHLGREGDTLEALTEVIRPDADAGTIRFGSDQERHEVVRQQLAHAASERPVILWIDDVQWGSDALDFVTYLLDRDAEQPVPVTVLMTAQEEALAERADVRKRLEALLSRPRCEAVEVGPLDPAAQRELVRALLGFEGGLAARLADRTRGNPLFTVQLVGDWVARGILVAGGSGFELREGAEVDLPDTLHDVWATRLQRLLADRSEARDALEIAAALGQEVDASEWTAICAHARVPLDPGMLDAMFEARLAVPTDEGWSFAHGMLRESVARLAREAGRWTVANARCAAALGAVEPVPHERLGRHLFAAEDHEQAIEHLARTRRGSRPEDAPTFGAGILDLREQALRRLGLPESDGRWGLLWLHKSEALRHEDPDGAVREVRRLRSASKRHGWTELAAHASLAQAGIARDRGDITRAIGLFERAVGELERSGLDDTVAEAQVGLAHTLILAGDVQAAEEPLDRARARYEAIDDGPGLATVIRFEGDIARLRREYRRARDCFREATRLNERSGMRSNAAAALHGVAEMERLLGHLDTAEGLYREVIERDTRVGSSTDIPRLNLALCLLSRGRFDDARAELTALLRRWTDQHKPGYAAVGHLSLLHATAGLGDWTAFDRHLQLGARLCNETGMVDLDLALACEAAGELAAAAGHPARARQGLELALYLWEALGDAERSDALLDRLGALP